MEELSFFFAVDWTLKMTSLLYAHPSSPFIQSPTQQTTYLSTDQLTVILLSHTSAQDSTMAETVQCSPSIAVTLFMTLMMMIWAAAAPCGGCPNDHKAALLEFRSLLVGNYSVGASMFDWNASISCCQWPRVSCYLNTKPTDRVIGLEFESLVQESSEQETAVISSDVLTPLFRLTTLRNLDLSENYIRGEIPPGIRNLTQLQFLDMSGNHFSGVIPPELFDLTQLNTLKFGINEVGKYSRWADGPLVRQRYKTGNSLEGEIPKEIGNLTNLVQLDMSSNKLSGEIPASLLGLNKLEYLDLQGNFLSGEIPSEIGNMLFNLTSFSVSDNHLTGDIPLSIRNMTRLTLLRLDNNLLSGDIPTWLFDFPEMQVLYLGRNNLTLRNARSTTMVPKFKLSELSLISCNITDGIPLWLANQTFLEYLDLSSNRMTGTFPKWLARMRILDLVLADNLLHGSLPYELFAYTGLQGPTAGILDLSRNNFGGKLPDPDTNKCAKYWYLALVLSDNEFSGPLPACIGSMSGLEILDLSRNQLSGKAFKFLCQDPCSCPLYVDLSYNTFHGNISISSGQAINLDVLELSHNNFTGISKLQNLEKLKFLDLHDNSISGTIPTSLAQISTLRVLSLRNNLLRGSIPGLTLSNLTKLQILDLSGNRLSGRVPQSLGNLTGMTVAPPDSSIKNMIFSSDYFNYFDREMLTSFNPLLEVFWKALHLGLPNQHLGLYTFLDLSSNRLSGEIPDSLGGLTSLKVLNISYNRISGRIPASFGNIRDLESLDLSHNDLSGEIPKSMGGLLQITDLKLSDNHLTGRIPSGPQMDRLNDRNSYANNDGGLCGMQIHAPCDGATTAAAAPEGEGTTENEEEGLVWFSWMTAGIGYPAGLVTTVLGMYGFGYFRHDSKLRRRRRMMRRQAIMF